jgi:broad specificity phosphatase PhoE
MPPDAAPTLVTLVRHGETAANLVGVWHGSTDTALTPRGRRQAACLAEHLAQTRAEASALYASPLARARDTAEPIAARLGLVTTLDPDLREYHLGAWEGVTYAALAREHRLFERMLAEPDWQPGGGESARQVAERLARSLLAIAARHPGERAIVVSHGGALTLGLGWLLDGSLSAWRRVMSNCAVSDLRFDPAPSLVVWNDVAHLDGLG